MMKLVSEQLPNDGTYHVKRLVNEANDRLKQIGRQGKRATIVAKKSSLSLQFTLTDEQGKKQRNVGLGAIPVSAKGILEAEAIARSVTNRLVAGKFDWDWFNDLIGKDTSEKTQVLTCKEMVEVYKKHYFKQRQSNKAVEESWYKRCKSIEEVLLSNENKCLSSSLVRQIVESKNNNSNARTKVINGLVEFLKYFNNTDFKEVIKQYKENNNPKPKKRSVPSDKRIIEVYKNGFIPSPYVKKYRYRYPQWQFLYGLLATYGLRIHEAWNIANWDKPVTLKDDDWLTVDVDDKNSVELQRSGSDLIVPAILDPNNTNYILCIKHDTKTGYRAAFPLSPEGHNWVEEFNLLQPLNLPDIPEPLKTTSKSSSGFPVTTATCHWFTQRKYGFTPHDLRHAWNHRGHQLGFNPKALADSLGHSITMNSTGYLRHMSDEVKLQGMKQAMVKEQNKRSENELLREENETLKAQLKAKDNEIELLKMKLKLNQTLKES